MKILVLLRLLRVQRWHRLWQGQRQQQRQHVQHWVRKRCNRNRSRTGPSTACRVFLVSQLWTLEFFDTSRYALCWERTNSRITGTDHFTFRWAHTTGCSLVSEFKSLAKLNIASTFQTRSICLTMDKWLQDLFSLGVFCWKSYFSSFLLWRMVMWRMSQRLIHLIGQVLMVAQDRCYSSLPSFPFLSSTTAADTW